MIVLIAEDDPVSRLILQRTVEKAGHECLVAKDGLEAWQLSQEAEVDVLISDRMMPGMDGIELCQRVREDPRPGYTYIIFLTALREKSHLLTGIQAGADDYLTKPLNREELEVRLISASRVTALHQQLAAQRGELERLNNNLFKQVRIDPLTQVANRLKLREDLEMLRGRVERYGHSYSAIMCDVDFFKLYNDTYGHLEGDRVLQAVAERIAKECRLEDQVYRYGGEEFLILMPEQSIQSSISAAGRIRRAIEALAIPHTAITPDGVVTISSGVAVLQNTTSEKGKGIDTMLKNADTALYHAKEAGRNRVTAFPG